MDYVDRGGAWVGSGATQPATAAYIRRWSIQPLPTNPNNTLVIQVLVTPIANEAARGERPAPAADARRHAAGDGADEESFMTARQRLQSEAGFSLIELLVSAAIMLTVTGAIFSLMAPAPGTTQAQTEVADMQQRVRIGADVLFKELVMTGAGIQGSVTGIADQLLCADTPAPHGVSPPRCGDGLPARRLHANVHPQQYTQTTVRQNMPIQSPEMKVNDQANCPKHDGLCGFETGMVVLIFDSTGHFDVFEITQLQSQAAHLQHRGQNLDYAYGADSQVTQIVNNTYYRDPATNQLMRDNGGLATDDRRSSTTSST